MNPIIGNLLVGMKFADATAPYTSEDLAADLSGGFRDILAGVGGDYLLTVDSQIGFIGIAHKDAVYGVGGDGISAAAISSGKNKPAIALTAAGIAMGYNRPSDGHWINGVAIEADGDAAFAGTIHASRIVADCVIAGGVTISGENGDTTLNELIAGGYSNSDLQADLASGVANILAGVGSEYHLDVSADDGWVLLKHKDAAYGYSAGGAGYTGKFRTAVGITANGIVMGYNNKTNGNWVNSISIDATTGTASFSGNINSSNANITGTLNVGSVIAGGVTVNGTSMLTIQNGAAAGATAVQPAALTAGLATKLTAQATYILGTEFSLKTPNYDAGSGIIITSTGILAKKSGVTKFAIDTNGDATFSGVISGGTGTFAGSINTAGSVNVTGAYGSTYGNVAICGAPSVKDNHGVIGVGGGISTDLGTAGIIGFGAGVGGIGVWAKKNTGTYGLYNEGRISTNDSTLVANLNAEYLNSKKSSDFAVWTGAAAVAGTVVSNYTIPMVIAGFNVRVLVAYP